MWPGANPMARIQRIKRRVLRQAVEDNVHLIEGTYQRRPQRRALWYFLGRGAGLAGVLALLVGAYLAADQVVQRLEAGPKSAAVTAGVPRPARVAAPESVEVPSTPPEPITTEVFPLAVRKVILDPGHGGDSTGTVAPGGLMEKDLTLDIAERLARLLEQRAYTVELTRRRDEDVSLEDRARMANESRGDIFLSIHVNWFETKVRGVETYYLGPTDDPYLTQLAARENRDSGYSMADFRKLLEQVYVHARQGESRRLASDVHRALYRSLTATSPELEDRGVKRAPFAVLTGTEMPAILAEVSSLSNDDEARLLATPDYRQQIAHALFEGIVTYSRRMTGTDRRTG